MPQWQYSAHRFASFNNPAYLFSVRNTRESVLARGRQRPGCPLLRRMPRPGTAVQRPVRRSRLRRRARSHGLCRHHLSQLPRHRSDRQRARQCRLRHRRSRTVSLLTRRSSRPFLAQRLSDQGETVAAQADVLETPAQVSGVLRHLPQGAPARGAEQLQVAARPEPLRCIPPKRRLRPRRVEFLLPARSGEKLQPLPHAARRVRGLRREAQ